MSRTRSGPVPVNPLLTCGDCPGCADGEYNRCQNIGTIGLSGGAGGFAEEAVVDPEPLVTGRVGLDEIVAEGFEALLDRTRGHVKILVEP